MTKLNLCPGIDWTKEDLIGYTSSDVVHLRNGTKLNASSLRIDAIDGELRKLEPSLSENYVALLLNSCYDIGYYICDCGDYLSIRNFTRAGFPEGRYTSSVADFKEHTKDYKISDVVGVNYIWDRETSSYQPSAECSGELRVYKDCSYSMVYQITFEDGTVKQYGVAHNGKTKYFSASARIAFTKDIDSVRSRDTFAAIESALTEEHGETGWLVEVESDEDVKALAFAPVFSKQIIKCLIACDEHAPAQDMRKRRLGFNSGEFAQETKDIIANFFNLDSPEHKDRWLEYRRRFPWFCRCSETQGDINNMFRLTQWMLCSGKKEKQRADKQKSDTDLWKTLKFSSVKNACVWERREDAIIITCNGSYTKAAFIYDLKKKTRKLLTQYAGYGRTDEKIKSVVPSLKALEDNIKLCGKHYSRKPGEEQIEQEIFGAATAEDLFAGTNVGWIIQNVDPDYKVIVYREYPEEYRTETWFQAMNQETPIKDLLKHKFYDEWVIRILATTGNPLLEQLLKNKMFNLYFACLDELNNNFEKFQDTTNKKNCGSYTLSHACVEYNGKEKSLKKMMHMTMDQIKLLNDAVQLVPEKFEWANHNWYPYSKYMSADDAYYDVPAIAQFSRWLPNEFNTIGLPNFQKMLKLAAIPTADSYRKDKKLSSLSRTNEVLDCLKQLQVKDALDTIENYININFETWNDYLRMRKRMKAIQESLPEEAVYNEDFYPMRPKNAIKFVQFRVGMRAPDYSRWNRNFIYTEEGFMDIYKARYPDSEVVPTYNEIGEKLVGAMLHLSPKDNMNHLHDELSFWVSFYEDEANDKLLKEAVKRVQPLEYTDEETGLSIIAPKSVADIKGEGDCLSHCVGSFVQPIIDNTENVMFIRRTDMIDMPFFTIALSSPKNNEKEEGYLRVIEQVHCYRNGSLTRESQMKAFEDSKYDVYNKFYDVAGFLTKWAGHFKDKVDAKSVRQQYGALCARRA